MDANPSHPSEREWTIEEREEFFKGVDAVTGIPNGSAVASNSGVWMSEIRHFTLQDLDEIFNRGIHVTELTPPEQGWPIAMHCPICKETTFVLSPWAIKPEKSDYFLMDATCGSEEHNAEHNMRIAMEGFRMPIQIPDYWAMGEINDRR